MCFPASAKSLARSLSANPLDTLVSEDSRTVDLLTAAEASKFDVLLTVDCGFEYEQNLGGRQIAILILSSKSIRLEDLLPRKRRAEGA